ncbi:hypothetical protein ISF_07030 [Cordyceps fumosorosea ARSEF 2679]|uniref:Uncharacterized protein n=1 Tax=Cordyceps fumosorosea (strain ARSEF 2679) TaxID=1081104 RepID=A0A167QN09_CORFA|nr:hypothetical protein ISF_07030 [Cordyceps fumosorosea ARSEF 2679]OAA57789.1 hypothetical protein ISF_07030 [Cordyceps fumosorosea ARSEF 2679]
MLPPPPPPPPQPPQPPQPPACLRAARRPRADVRLAAIPGQHLALHHAPRGLIDAGGDCHVHADAGADGPAGAVVPAVRRDGRGGGARVPAGRGVADLVPAAAAGDRDDWRVRAIRAVDGRAGGGRGGALGERRRAERVQLAGLEPEPARAGRGDAGVVAAAEHL